MRGAAAGGGAPTDVLGVGVVVRVRLGDPLPLAVRVRDGDALPLAAEDLDGVGDGDALAAALPTGVRVALPLTDGLAAALRVALADRDALAPTLALALAAGVRVALGDAVAGAGDRVGVALGLAAGRLADGDADAAELALRDGVAAGDGEGEPTLHP